MLPETIDEKYSNINNALLAEYKDFPGSMNGKFHSHDNYELLLCLSDDMFCETETARVDVGKYSLLLFNSLDLHHFGPKRKDGENLRYVIHFDPNFLGDISTGFMNLTDCFLYRPFENAFCLPLEIQQAEMLKKLIDRLIEIDSKTGEELFGREMLRKLILSEILILTNGWYRNFHELDSQAASSRNSYIYELIQYIQDNFTEELSLDTLARKFYVNKCNLCESFRQVTGVSPYSYIINCRISKAKRLLINGSAVELACSESGFNNLSHFSRIFRQRVGQSPKQYQKTMRSKKISYF